MKEKKNQFDLLPNVLLRYICSFLEMVSFARFSLANKRNFTLFSHIPKILKTIKMRLPK